MNDRDTHSTAAASFYHVAVAAVAAVAVAAGTCFRSPARQVSPRPDTDTQGISSVDAVRNERPRYARIHTSLTGARVNMVAFLLAPCTTCSYMFVVNYRFSQAGV